MNDATFLSRCSEQGGKGSETGAKLVNTPGWPHTEDTAEVELSLNTLLSLSSGFPDKWESGRKSRGQVEDPVLL